MPSLLVELDGLPLNSHGKIDRRALSQLQDREAHSDGPGLTRVSEQRVATVWSELLGVAEVGRDDDFFAAGGHSLLAVQVTARLRDDFGVEVPLRAFFERPTVKGLAEAVERAQSAALQSRLAPGRRPDVLPASYEQERLWFLHQLAPGDSSYNMPVALRIGGELDPSRLQRSLAEVMARHEVLRTRFVAESGVVQQLIDPPSAPLLPLIDLRGLDEDTQQATLRRLTAEEALRPFDLARGPLLRARFIRLGADDQVVLVTLHHVAGDGWSMRVLWRELLGAYESLARSWPSPLPALPVQYADYAAWQRQRFLAGRLDEQLAYWRAGAGRRSARRARARPPAAVAATSERRGPADCRRPRALRRADRPRAARGHDALHDAARRVHDAAPSRDRPDRPERGHAGSRAASRPSSSR